MRKINTKCLLAAAAILITPPAFSKGGGDSGGIDLPSATPVRVFEMSKDQIGVGLVSFDVNLELKDEYYGDKIGNVNFETKGLIVTHAADKETFVGKMYEYSYTFGYFNSKLKDKVFTDGGINYNNTYDKSGFYVGWRPAFSNTLSESSLYRIQHATALHVVLYTMSGDFSVNQTNGSNRYAYDGKHLGVGVKPTTVLSGTYFPINNLGLSVYGGLSTFAAIDLEKYNGKTYSSEEDLVLGAFMSQITPLYGFDIVFKGIMSKDDSFNLSSAVTQRTNDNSAETILRYVLNF